ncbi:MAG TPA: hypothetical protein ENH34_04365 [Phycisphaerales bacterium]|nr:hypothetical protein [Phycisphaerales bacterium]
MRLKKRRFLKAELVVLLCVTAVWAVNSGAIDSVKTGVLKQVIKTKPDDAHANLLLGRITAETVAQDVADHASGSMLTAESKRLFKQQEEQQLKNLDMELAYIDEYVLQQRQNIESWYASNVANLQRWAKERLAQLDGAEKAAWARFCQNMENTMSNKTGYLTMNSYGYADTYFTGDGYATTNSYVMTDGYFSEKTNTFVVGNPAGRYESEIGQIKNSKDAIKLEFSRLSRMRESYLAELEQYAKRRREGLRAETYKTIENTKIKIEGGPGLIEAIFWSDKEESSIMFDNEILCEGNIINGFKVNKIYPDRVEFEKNRKIWVQKLQ